MKAIRTIIRTWLLPGASVLAYTMLANHDYASKIKKAAESNSLDAYSSSDMLINARRLQPPTCSQLATLVAGNSAPMFRELMFFVFVWIFYYTFIHVLYYAAGWGIRQLFKLRHPTASNLKLSRADQWKQIRHSESAFPMYCLVPTIGDVLAHHGWSQATSTFEECGGVVQSVANFFVYMFLVEGGVFFVHYWMLHKWTWGKRNLNHDSHHQYVFDDEMTTWSGFAFEAIDGTLQGVPFVLYQFVVPVPKPLTVAAGASVGIWTLYIHVAEPALPWPFMGADYHSVHHIYNWFNFGLFTVLWDYLHNTLRHPDEATRKFTLATKQKRKDLKELHQMWSKSKST
mmetsp:Transcript_27573/g.53572  ORF Transcript_27573/g.53572 Transcript_27573/m.53572 type:complete len:343 (-) Transcript_27573:228-1256(-)